MGCKRLIHPFERVHRTAERFVKFFEWLARKSERLTQPFERVHRTTERVTKFFKRLTRTGEWLTYPFERLIKISERVPQMTEQLTLKITAGTKRTSQVTSHAGESTGYRATVNDKRHPKSFS